MWLIQLNLQPEPILERLTTALKEHHQPFELVTVVPFSHEILPENIAAAIRPSFVYGSTTMIREACRRGWPVFYDANIFDYKEYNYHMGKDMLNHACSVHLWGDVDLFEHIDICEELFVRPTGDLKQFAGKIVTREDMHEWFERIINLEGTDLRAGTTIMTSAPKTIFAEYRAFVVDGKFVTGAIYKVNDEVHQDALLSTPIPGMQDLIDKWQPARAFVIDVAMAKSGLKVIEYNCINASGFYGADIDKVVHAIARM